jgi:hypothetical protein
MTYKEIISTVSEQTGIPFHTVDATYKSYWKAVWEHISSLPLKDDLTDEEFLKLRPNVNIPSIGKLCVTLDRYRRMKKMHRMFEERKQNEKL